MIVGVTLAPALDRTARVERIEFDTILRPTEVRVAPGGKGVNACRAARLLGADVATAGLAGGHAGRWLTDALEREGLNPHFVSIDAETRTTYVTVDARGRSVLIYEPGAAAPRDAADALLETVGRLVRDGDWLICSGSAPAGLDDDIYGRLVEIGRSRGAASLIDAGGRLLTRSLDERPDVVKVSLAEARDALGSTAAAGYLAQALVARGARLAVVTDGARGAAAADGHSSWTISVPRVRPVNVIGAGDVFNAALAIALARGDSTRAALGYAAAAATASVFELRAGDVDRARLEEIRPRVNVRETRNGTP